MKITSDAFREGETIPLQYTAEGLNVNPPLQFEGVPNSAQSLALVVEDWDVMVNDPDAPDNPWVHWLVYNIPPNSNMLPQGDLVPGAVEGVTTGGVTGYQGPNPPEGEHEYRFRLYALDTRIEGTENVDRSVFLNLIHDHVVDEATLTGTYRREPHEKPTTRQPG